MKMNLQVPECGLELGETDFSSPTTQTTKSIEVKQQSGK